MMPLKNLITKIFEISLNQLATENQISNDKLKELPIRIEKSREEKLGDYACTSAMDKKIRELFGIKNPRQLAELWVNKIKQINLELKDLNIKDKYNIFNNKIQFSDLFEDINIAGAGFINVFISKKILLYYLFNAIEQKENYGNQKKENPRNIIFEFVSANPTGPLNIVSARAAALGDSCCNLLEAIGENVYREYYVNDYGNQVELLGISCLFRLLEQKGIKLKFSKKENNQVIYPEEEGLPFPSEAYHGEYIIDALNEILKKEPVHISENEFIRLNDISKRKDLTEEHLEEILSEDLKQIANHLSRLAIEYFLNTHKEDLKNFRVSFDNFFLESSLHNSGKVKEVLKDIQPYIYEKENKIFFKSTAFGDDQDRVIIRDNGKPTYLLADIAYHKTKIERGFSDIINIWGPDHHGYIARLKGAVQAMGFPPEKFIILIAQQVTLLEDGKPIVMSKRAGKIIRMKELIEEVPIDVARYFFVMRSFDAHLDFDLNEAKDTSEKNPYYYVAYAHARIQSIFRKIEQEIIFSFTQEELLSLNQHQEILSLFKEWNISYKNMISDSNDYRRNLLLNIARFLEEIYESAINFEPHRLIFYLYQIANDMAKFYSQKDNKIIEKDEKEAKLLMLILLGIKICLKKGLNLLGMEAPDRLEREE
ncbi:MAG: arginine--tRNA ligase [Leptospiraceae bacterium]|nr:MAG: arginine--tRNA ligase [Leptospiraceae bacterium]